MRNACSLGLVPDVICHLNIITRGLMVRDRRPRSPGQTGSMWRWLVTTATWAIVTSSGVGAQQTPEQRALIEEGRKLFFQETFGGNGRTCGTCHPATNNFTIDPAFVRSLPGKDPLFIVKSTKELKDLEIKQFLRQGTILENLDGFENPGVMRGVPHTLGLNASAGRTGWSGDGSPGAGAPLHTFATGAVTQHFPKTLARRSCTVDNFDPDLCDFRLPTEHELDAMEAFQRSLGRQSDPILTDLAFNDDTVVEGKALFLGAAIARDGNPRACSGCHANGGTSDQQRDTGVAHLASAPACQFGFKVPGDGGLGLGATQPPITTKQLCGKGPNTTVQFLGDGTFNTPPVIEAADTPPFFHNNAVAKLEEAVAFYTTDTFNNSANGAGRAFILDQDEINAIGAFLRALNALENIRSSNAYAQRSIDPEELAPLDELVELAIAETMDAIEVLTKGPIKLYPIAVAALKDARTALKRNDIDEAIALQEAARADIVVVGP